MFVCNDFPDSCLPMVRPFARASRSCAPRFPLRLSIVDTCEWIALRAALEGHAVVGVWYLVDAQVEQVEALVADGICRACYDY